MDDNLSRPRTHSRTFSRSSDKSAGRQPEPLSPSENSAKARRDSLLRGESKANPNAAILEAQPGYAATAERTTIDSIRNIQHKDAHGNVITEPDLSNPTRPRWERPLDTIRSFEKSIDGGYKRKSISRADTYDSSNQYASRRSSYFGGSGYDSGPSPNRYSRAGSGYYGNGRPDSYYDGQGSSPAAPNNRQRYGGRVASDPHFGRSNGNGGYPQHGHQQSHDTVNTGLTNGSDSTGPWNNSTDPSSENSSPDRANGRVKRTPQPMNDYGIDGVGGETIMEEYGGEQGGYPQRMQRGYGGNGAPPAPSHSEAPRKPIALGNSGGGGSDAFASQPGHLPTTTRPQEEKKKGWLKRRFSKKE